MTDIIAFPDGLQFFSVQQVQGEPCLFTHANPRGDGWLTFTALGYALENRCGLTLDGSSRAFSVAEMAAIRAHPAVAAFSQRRVAAAQDFWAMIRA